MPVVTSLGNVLYESADEHRRQSQAIARLITLVSRSPGLLAVDMLEGFLDGVLHGVGLFVGETTGGLAQCLERLAHAFQSARPYLTCGIHSSWRVLRAPLGKLQHSFGSLRHDAPWQLQRSVHWAIV